MKKQKHRLITLGILLSIATGIIYLANKAIAASAIVKGMLIKEEEDKCYKWRFGNVSYRKKGTGKPVLLIHDLSAGGSGYEWKNIIEELSEKNTVYVLDLLGCGKSDKPKITYTNYLYVQLICDFVKNVIGEQTDIIASGMSTSAAIMACNAESDLFNRLMLVSPMSLVELNKIPGKNSNMQKFILEIPILGTMIYHILFSMFHVKHLFMETYMFNPFHIDTDFIDAYYEASHRGDGAGRYLYSSIVGRYMNFNIIHGLKNVDNSIFLVGGKERPGNEEILENYTEFNSSIETITIPKAKLFPHIEQPKEFLKQVSIYFSE